MGEHHVSRGQLAILPVPEGRTAERRIVNLAARSESWRTVVILGVALPSGAQLCLPVAQGKRTRNGGLILRIKGKDNRKTVCPLG